MKTKKEIEFFRRSVGCGIKDKPPIFGKVWMYIDWIKEKIKDAPEPAALNIKCDAKVDDQKISLAKKLKTKGPGIIKEYALPPEGQIQKVEKSVTKTFDMTDNKDFDVDVETLFNKL
jgi:hypothetical protein